MDVVKKHYLPAKNGTVAGDAQEILQLPFNSTRKNNL
jgi:hypothetical protein